MVIVVVEDSNFTQIYSFTFLMCSEFLGLTALECIALVLLETPAKMFASDDRAAVLVNGFMAFS